MHTITVNARETVTYERDYNFKTKEARDEFLSRLKEVCENEGSLFAGDYFSARDIIDGDGIELDELTISENNKGITGEVLEE